MKELEWLGNGLRGFMKKHESNSKTRVCFQSGVSIKRVTEVSGEARRRRCSLALLRGGATKSRRFCGSFYRYSTLKKHPRGLTKIHRLSWSWRIACVLGLAMPSLTPRVAHGAEGPGSFSYEGRIYNEFGEPSSATVRIILRVMDPAGTCVLREEKSDAIDLSTTAGFFSVAVGQGTVGGVDPGLTLVQIFANGSSVVGKTEANASCTYAPTAGAGRKLRVIIEENSTHTALTPDVSIGTAPYAIAADSLQGLPPSAFLQPRSSSSTALTQANLESLFSLTRIPALQALADGTSSVYVKKSSDGSATLPSFSSASTPSSPSAGSIWYDSTANKIKYYDGSVSQIVSTASSSSGITSLTVGSDLTAGGTAGGTLTSSGTIDLASTGVAAGSYSKVTVDAKGRVTAGASLAEVDLPTLSTAGKVSGSAITSGTIGGATVINTTGTVTASSLSSNIASLQTMRVYDASHVKKVTLSAPTTIATDFNLVLPDNPGTAGYALTTDGSGVLTWTSVGGGGGSGTVTNVTANTPLSVTTGATTPSISIAQANASTSGYLSNTDWNTFNNKQGTTLSAGNIWVGNGSNIATGVSPSGDVTMTNSGNFTVTSIRTRSVSSSAPSSGQVLRYSSGQWAPDYMTIGDLRSSVTTANPFLSGTGCNVGEALTWNSITDSMSCNTITVDEASVTYGAKAGNTVFASPGGGGVPTWRALTVSDIPPLSSSSLTDGVRNGGQTGSVIVGTSDSTMLSLQTNNVMRMRVDSSGNIGIGTSSPSTRLHILSQGSSPTESVLKLENPNASAPVSTQVDFVTNSGVRARILASQVASGTGGSLGLYRTDNGGASNERMRLDNYGSVGIGTSSPAVKLDVAGQILSRQQGTQTGSTVNFNYSNSVVLSSTGVSSLALSGLQAGGSYTLVITDTTSRTYSFTGCVTHYKTPSSATDVGTHTIFSFTVVEVSATLHCYIAWATGFN